MKPSKEIGTWNGQTYFVTSNCDRRLPFFREERWAKLFLEALYAHRLKRYLLHGFVLMPDHFHLLITPRVSIETAVECLKNAFSSRATQELGFTREIWAEGFTDQQVRGEKDFKLQLAYIANNPVEAGLAEKPELYAYCSSHGSFELDAYPPAQKPEPPPPPLKPKQKKPSPKAKPVLSASKPKKAPPKKGSAQGKLNDSSQ